MTTRFDEGPEFDPDDPLAVILGPPADYLGAPPGRYEAIRRAASRRRRTRAAAGVGLSCGVAALIALQLHLASPGAPVSPAVPLAPPPASGRTAPPTPSASPSEPASPSESSRPESAGPHPSSTQRRDNTRAPSRSASPTRGPSVTPTQAGAEPSRTRPSAVATPDGRS
ncbi:hypothetical protein [Streptomyces herbicida]|uniref:hypothetical protein n=1 Tax=Streptomyces herbicida TaxID=3065675 RepID=UPI002930D2A2|nr:hypothetical protein [Streptomyces sp. NEAU-HV9]